jgi:hypothetical protein
VLDDLHWADLPSLRLLDALGAHVGVAPVLVLGTYRDTEPDAAAGLDGIAAERRIVLRGLPVPDLGRAVAATTGETLASDVLDALHERTGGNPFFASEIVRLLRAEGTLPTAAATALPSGVRAVLERRLERLPDRTETLLRAAAALDAGTTTGADTVLLAAAADVAPADVAELLAPAVRALLVHTDGGRYRFAHALVADTLTARTPPGQRLGLHRRAAAALGARVRAGVGDPAEEAHQLLAAARLSGDPADARAAAASGASAARAAVERAAYEDAVHWLEEGLAALGSAAAPAEVGPEVAETGEAGTVGTGTKQAGPQRAGQEGSPDDGPDRGELLCALGEAALAAGDRDRARSAFADAAAHARRQPRPEVLAAAALGRTGGAAGFEVDLADPDRVVLLEEALAALPSADSAQRCALSARLSVALAFTGAEQRRHELAADAASVARRLNNPRALACALAASCDAMAGPDHVEARRLAATEIIASARTARDRVLELLGRRLRLLALAEAGRWAEVDTEIEGYDRLALPLRQVGLAWYVPLWRGARAIMRGDMRGVAAHGAELQRRAERSASINAELLYLTQQFVVAALAGRPAEITMDRFLQLAPEAAVASLCTTALLRALAGDADAASILHTYLDSRDTRPPDSEWLPEMVQAAQTAVLVADLDAAAVVYEKLAPYAGLFAIEGILAGTWGSVDAHLGRLAQLLGRPEQARSHLAAAVRLDADAGATLGERSRRWAEQTFAPVSGVSAVPDAASFRREGEVWTLAYQGRAVQLRDTKGLRDLAALLARPGRELAVHELAGLPPAAGNGAFELVDGSAIDAYRHRLLDLEAELDEAATAHDPIRGERAAAEREALIDELAAVTGLGGRPRRAGSDAERLRKAVGNRIRQALQRIENLHPELGRHLRVSVRTGTFCRYQPDREVRWTL